MKSTTGNIILTGFMGTGKSTVGRIIADRLGTTLVDTDAEIEREHGSIPDIFANHGESRFRELERALIADLVERSGPMVIATGGGTAVDPDNAAALESLGPVYALTAEPEEIVRRVQPDRTDDRPLLAGREPAREVEHLLARRAIAYSRFATISTDGRSPAEVAEEIIADVFACD